MDRKTLILPILLIGVGIGWLLTTLNVTPGVNWAWTLSLSVVGLVAFVVAFDKFTFVAGSFFVVAGILSLLRQTDRLDVDLEVPILVIVAGILLLIARHPAIPIPQWVHEPPKSS